LLLLVTGMSTNAQYASLKPVYASPDNSRILDYRYGKVLTVKQDPIFYYKYTYRLTDVSTGHTEVIPYTGIYLPRLTYLTAIHFRAWITPYGALIMVPTDENNDNNASLYEYRQGMFNMLSPVARNVSLAGDYLLWENVYDPDQGLLLRNLATQQQQRLVDSAVTGAAVTSSGFVSYSTGRYLYKYQNGVSTLIDQWNELETPNTDYPPGYHTISTDGERITYHKSTRFAATNVYLYEHDSVTLLLTQGDANAHTDFLLSIFAAPLVNNGYIGGADFSSPFLNNFQGQIYTRDRQGHMHYMLPMRPNTPVAFASVMNVSPQGDVAVSARSGYDFGTRYRTFIIKQDGSAIRKIADVESWANYEDSTWFILSGRFVFSVNPDTAAPQHAVMPISKQVNPGTRLFFKAADFRQHYIGPDSGIGQLEQIEFLSLPKRGLLRGANNQIIDNGNAVIPRNLLDSLRYIAPGITSHDTIRWRVFDGMNYTNDTAIYINIAMIPDTIKPFERNTLAGTPIRFLRGNFTQNYTGKLKGIRVNRLPAYGKLTIGGKQLFYERSTEITLAEIDSMYYTPNPNIVGVDTLQWMAFNGTSYTKNDTPAILRVYPVLNTPPILRTLQRQYSHSGATDTILIANYPIPQARTDVMAVVDNSRMLTIAANHTFVVEPSTYSIGTHRLKVTFKHKLDSISIQRSFTVTSPFAPMMMSADQHQPVQQDGVLRVWPNPFGEQFTISGLDANSTYTLRLYDAQGRLVMSSRSFNQSRKVLIPVNGRVNKGMYLLEVYDDKNKKVVKCIQLLRL